MPEWVSAHQIPGVRQLGRRDEADTLNFSVLMRNNGPPAPKYQMILIARPRTGGEVDVRRGHSEIDPEQSQGRFDEIGIAANCGAG